MRRAFSCINFTEGKASPRSSRATCCCRANRWESNPRLRVCLTNPFMPRIIWLEVSKVESALTACFKLLAYHLSSCSSSSLRLRPFEYKTCCCTWLGEAGIAAVSVVKNFARWEIDVVWQVYQYHHFFWSGLWKSHKPKSWKGPFWHAAHPASWKWVQSTEEAHPSPDQPAIGLSSEALGPVFQWLVLLLYLQAKARPVMRLDITICIQISSIYRSTYYAQFIVVHMS